MMQILTQALAENTVCWLFEQPWARAGHTGRSLLNHLLGTFAILKACDTDIEIQLAGLLHSAYGTKAFVNELSKPSREEIRDRIGREAEALVYAFSIADRPRCFDHVLRGNGSSDELKLLVIDCANLVEQRTGNFFLDRVLSACDKALIDCPPLLRALASSAVRAHRGGLQC